jgi:uncharacterized membrane protein
MPFSTVLPVSVVALIMIIIPIELFVNMKWIIHIVPKHVP